MRALAFLRRLVRKHHADGGSDLAALLTYYGFLAVFPMLLAGVTVLGLVLRGHPGLQERLLASSVAEFPVIGSDLRANVRSLPGVTGLVTGLVVGLLGARGFCLQLQRVVEVVWAVPREKRSRVLARELRTLKLVTVVGVGVISSAALSALATTSPLRLLLLALVVPAAALLLLAVLRFAAPDQVPIRDLVVAACLAAVGLVALQVVGAQLVTHLTTSREVYGTFAAVLGLLAWIYLQARVMVLAMEIGQVTGASAPDALQRAARLPRGAAGIALAEPPREESRWYRW